MVWCGGEVWCGLGQGGGVHKKNMHCGVSPQRTHLAPQICAYRLLDAK